MERTLFGFIWRYSKRQQITILAITLCSFPILYMTLELPKWIVNDAISGTNFPKEVLGFELQQIPYLIALCCVFLGLVVLNNVVKYVLNMTKGVAGERMLRRLRFMLYNFVLRFRLPRFRRVSSGEIIPMITSEVEDVGGFIGEAIATPAFQGGTLLVYIVFIFAQDPFLGAAAISLYPLQAYIIPKLQRRVIVLTRERVKNVRVIADKIGESVNAASDIHANDTARWHLADLSGRLFVNYKIRLAIYKRKFMIKFLNNFMNQLPPFFFYSVGGALVIQGDLSFGALVAVLAAYKDLASPWKELLNWYQNLATVSVKYQTVVENFDVEDVMAAERLLGGRDGETVTLDNLDIALTGVTVAAGGSGTEVEDVSLSIPTGAQVAVYGRDGSGRSELLMTMAGLLAPMAGRATIAGRRFDELSHATIAGAISYVGNDPYMFNDTIRANVVYALRASPTSEAEDEEAAFRRAEAALTGNSILDASVPWEDHARAGLSEEGELDQRVLELFELVGLSGDLYRLGLGSHLDEDVHSPFIDKVLAARQDVERRVREDKSWANLIEPWSMDAFNQSATLGENVLFALPRDKGTAVWDTVDDPAIRAALTEAKVFDTLVDMGAAVAATMVELFSDTGADASLIGDYSFLSADELPLFQERVRMHGVGKGLSQEDKIEFVRLAFRLIPGRHRILSIEGADEAALIAARRTVHQRLADSEAYVRFDRNAFLPPLSIEENILFGKPRVDRRGASDKIDASLRETVNELGLREPIAQAGLDFRVGVAGGRLSASQRRRLGLIRALLKRPQVIIVDGIADGDPRMLQRMVAASAESTLIAGTTDPAIARQMSEVIIMRDGRLAGTGPWDSVSALAREEPAEMEEAS